MHDRHPELIERTELKESNGYSVLRIAVAEHDGVGLGMVHLKRTPVWSVMDPLGPHKTSIWPISTCNEVLVDALHALAEARLSGCALASPWRWQESEPTDLTELADLLDAKEVTVRRVVGGNRYFMASEDDDQPKLKILNGNYVEAESHDTVVRISLTSHLGWMMHVYAPELNGWGRVDLGRALERRRLPVPGVPRGQMSLSSLAQLLADGPATWEPEGPWSPEALEETPRLYADLDGQISLFPDDTRTHSDHLSADWIVESIHQQLRLLGFNDIEKGDVDNPLQSDTFHFVWHDRDKTLYTSDVQRFNGLAAAAGDELPKRLIVISRSEVSKPAASFADKAKAFIFRCDPECGRLYGLNSRAEQVMPPHGEPQQW